MELKGSKTEKNLLEAFAGESMARNKYTYYASKAKKDGYVQISKIFEETADNEKEHAKIWYKYLHGGKVAGTEANLKDAADGENFEWTDMYARMAAEARAEGFDEIADKFEMVGAIERAQSADTWWFAFLAFIFRHLVQGVNRDEHNIVMVIDDFYHLLHLIAIRYAHQSAKASDAVVQMHHIIANLELLQFL